MQLANYDAAFSFCVTSLCRINSCNGGAIKKHHSQTQRRSIFSN